MRDAQLAVQVIEQRVTLGELLPSWESLVQESEGMQKFIVDADVGLGQLAGKSRIVRP